jgi:hypothetical protein
MTKFIGCCCCSFVWHYIALLVSVVMVNRKVTRQQRIAHVWPLPQVFASVYECAYLQDLVTLY